jgi:hypothetical protein
MHHLDRRGMELTGLIMLTAVLQFSAAAGISYVAGFPTSVTG